MFFANFGTSLALIASFFQQKSIATELLTVHIEHYLHRQKNISGKRKKCRWLSCNDRWL